MIVMVAAAAVVAAVVLWWALPRLVAAMPGRILHYVPDEIVERVTTPLPTAPPPPAAPAAGDLELALATPVPSPTPAPTLEATLDEVAVDTPLPTAEASTPTLTPAPETSPTPAGPPLPAAARIDGLPIIPQKFNNCGPTNMTIVLNYYGIDVDQFDVAGVARPNYEDRNVSPGELVSFVTGHTELAAGSFAGGDITLLRRLIASGFPVIIEKGLEPDPATGWMGHYLTVFGYDDDAGHFLVRDTYLGPWKEDGLASYEDTARYWAHFNGTFIVVYPPERTAELNETLGPTFVYPVAMWEAAAERARATIRLTPEDAFAWFNLGTSLTALAGMDEGDGRYAAAAAAYDQARTLGLPEQLGVDEVDQRWTVAPDLTEVPSGLAERTDLVDAAVGGGRVAPVPR